MEGMLSSRWFVYFLLLKFDQLQFNFHVCLHLSLTWSICLCTNFLLFLLGLVYFPLAYVRSLLRPPVPPAVYCTDVCVYSNKFHICNNLFHLFHSMALVIAYISWYFCMHQIFPSMGILNIIMSICLLQSINIRLDVFKIIYCTFVLFFSIIFVPTSVCIFKCLFTYVFLACFGTYNI